MNDNWLVIDLRNNQIAIGRLEVRETSVAWEKKEIDYGREGYDTDFVIDLCYFQEPGSNTWTLTQQSYLATLGKNVKQIPCLFDEPQEWLKSNLSKLLGKLFSSAIKEYPQLPLLFLCDRIEIQSIVNHVFQKIIQDRPGSMVRYLSPRYQNLAGFVMLDRKAGALPSPGTVVAYQLSGGKELETSSNYQWDGLAFQVLASRKARVASIPFTGSQADLERAGAAVFILFWRQLLAAHQRVEVEQMSKRIGEKAGLVSQMRVLLEKLGLHTDNPLSAA